MNSGQTEMDQSPEQPHANLNTDSKASEVHVHFETNTEMENDTSNVCVVLRVPRRSLSLKSLIRKPPASSLFSNVRIPSANIKLVSVPGKKTFSNYPVFTFQTVSFHF